MKLPICLYNKGTVIWIEFPFEDGNSSKRRPAIITDFNSEITRVIVLKVTSHEPRTQYDYILNDAEFANLKKDSVVRCNKIFQLNNDQLCEKCGELTRQDMMAIEILYMQALVNESYEI